MFLTTHWGGAASGASKAHTIFAESTGSRFKPIAIYNDGISTTALEVWRPTRGGTITSTMINPGSAITIAGNSSGIIPVVLRDDGTQGDALAGDGIYTLWPITSTKTPDQFDGRLYWDSYHLIFPGVDGNITLSSRLGIVRSGLQYPTRTLGTDVDGHPITASDYMVNIQDDAIADGSLNGSVPENLGAITDKFYSVFDDRFDFLVPFSVLKTDSGSAYYVGLRNNVSGLGNSGFGPLFDNTAANGIPPPQKNAGVLQGIPYVNDGGISVYGSLHHEIMHRWGVFFGTNLGFVFSAHWNGRLEPGIAYVCNFSAALDGSAVTENGDGTVTISPPPPAPRYAGLELYLMGLMAPSEVPVHRFYRFNESDNSVVQRLDLSATNLTAAFGPRLPAHTNSQRRFAAAFVVVTPPGEPLTSAETAMYSLAAEHFGSSSPGEGFVNGHFVRTPCSFAWATGFRATMRTFLFPPAAEPLRLTRISVNAGTHTASLTIAGKSNTTYQVYRSFDLGNWGAPIGSARTGNNGNSTGDAIYQDASANQPAKFYRIREQ